jgi:preprotein translocase subunit YajC
MGPRSLDTLVPDQSTSLWILLVAAVALILGIAIRAWRAELKREKEEQERFNSSQ